MSHLLMLLCWLHNRLLLDVIKLVLMPFIFLSEVLVVKELTLLDLALKML